MVRRVPQNPPDSSLATPYYIEFVEIYKSLQLLDEAIEAIEEPANNNLAANVVILPGPQGTTQHRTIGAGEIHVPYNWQVATFSGLSGISVTNQDVGKIAWVQGTNKYYTLTNSSPKTWVLWNGEASILPQLPTITEDDLIISFLQLDTEYSVSAGRILNIYRKAITFADSPYTCEKISQILDVDDSGGNVVVNLPDMLTPHPSSDPLEIVINKVVSSPNNITVQGNGKNIWDSPTLVINFYKSAARLLHNRNRWTTG